MEEAKKTEEITKKRGIISASVMTILVSKRMLIRAFFTFCLFGLFIFILILLFRYKVDGQFRDLLNILLGTFMGVFNNAFNFWFKRDDEDTKEDKVDPFD